MTSTCHSGILMVRGCMNSIKPYFDATASKRRSFRSRVTTRTERATINHKHKGFYGHQQCLRLRCIDHVVKWARDLCGRLWTESLSTSGWKEKTKKVTTRRAPGLPSFGPGRPYFSWPVYHIPKVMAPSIAFGISFTGPTVLHHIDHRLEDTNDTSQNRTRKIFLQGERVW